MTSSDLVQFAALTHWYARPFLILWMPFYSFHGLHGKGKRAVAIGTMADQE